MLCYLTGDLNQFYYNYLPFRYCRRNLFSPLMGYSYHPTSWFREDLISTPRTELRSLSLSSLD